MKTIHVLVIDSYHTTTIAERLTNYYKEKSAEQAVICHAGNCPDSVRADIFVLSARDVLDTPGYIDTLKASNGKPTTKVLVLSALDSYLKKIRENPELGVDFTLPKGHLSDIVGESRLSEHTVTQTLDSLLKSATHSCP